MRSLENPLFKRDTVSTRTPQTAPNGDSQAGLRIVSADGHWEVEEDIWYENFPAHLKEQAPRVWFDEYWHLGNPDAPLLPLAEEKLRSFLPRSVGSGAWDMERRTKDLIAEGIQKEIIYPQSLLSFVGHPDLEIQEQIYWHYNNYIAKICSNDPTRYYGVGVSSNWWDPARSPKAVQQIVDLGLKTMMLPTSNVGTTPEGRKRTYADESMDPMWEACAAAGLPVTFHVGENFSFDGRGAFVASGLANSGAARKPFSELIFGGVFDRHPNLKVVFSEFGINWIAGYLQDAEAGLDQFGPVLDDVDSMPKARPTEYWREHCYATFQNDKLGLELLDYIGADRVMWAQDYPHNESTFGYSWSSRDDIIAATTPENARRILGETAIELYGLDD